MEPTNIMHGGPFNNDAGPSWIRPPIVWTIAGTDPGAGAGIQADLKTFRGLGVYGCSVITAVIAQNTRGIRRIEYPEQEMIRAQLEVLEEDFPPAAIKIGMLGTAATVRIVADTIQRLEACVVCDPILRSTSGTDLLSPNALVAFKSELLPHVDLLTPNLPEAELLAGKPVRTPDEVIEAADAILESGCRSVLIKGGHADGDHVQDLWTDGQVRAWFTSARIASTHTHGTGCALSSAIAATCARGCHHLDTLVLGRAYVNHGLRHAPQLGQGNGPIHHGDWPHDPADLPWLTATADEGRATWRFPPCDPLPLGLYPIVDSLAWVKKLLPLGVRTLQLRIKQPLNAQIEQDIREAIALAKESGAHLYINDHWRPALAWGAYGVHLGQDDLDDEALRAIEQAGCRLGLSTHSYTEIARAWTYRPSYIAIGTVFKSPSKYMTYPPLGIANFAAMRAMSPCPVVAIGGMTLEKAPALIQAGADGIAVISDVTHAADLAARVREWQTVY